MSKSYKDNANRGHFSSIEVYEVRKRNRKIKRQERETNYSDAE